MSARKNQKEYKYDTRGQKRIWELCDVGSYKKALIECNEYLTEFPYDERIPMTKARILRKLHRYEESLEALDNYNPNQELAIFKIEKLYSLMCLRRYEEASVILSELLYEYFVSIPINDQLKRVGMVILKNASLEEFNKKYNLEDYKFPRNYLERQLISYDYFEMIAKMQIDLKRTDKQWNFNPEFNLEKELIQAADKIATMEHVSDILFDVYYIHSPNCGISRGKNCNYLKVATIKGTKDIVKIYPENSDAIIVKEKRYF